ncbi:TRAPP complex subunit Bet5 [Pseudohyphozyma bogoriensis]|nr:TRAPP complex subunit Bet5 [Pseudohyphozyma bogoriensis]
MITCYTVAVSKLWGELQALATRIKSHEFVVEASYEWQQGEGLIVEFGVVPGPGMLVRSFYVFDRHCTCVFFSSFNTPAPRAGPTTLPNVYRANLSLLPSVTSPQPPPVPTRRDSVMSTMSTATGTTAVGEQHRGSVVAPWDRAGLGVGKEEEKEEKEKEGKGGLALDEEAKLVYGVVFSLRNMVKKLSGRDDDSFHSFSTSAYKLHYLNTSTSTHFVLVTSPMSESLRFVLNKIYKEPYAEYVVRNPMVGMDSAESGKGIDSDAFRLAVEKIVAGL